VAWLINSLNMSTSSDSVVVHVGQNFSNGEVRTTLRCPDNRLGHLLPDICLLGHPHRIALPRMVQQVVINQDNDNDWGTTYQYPSVSFYIMQSVFFVYILCIQTLHVLL